MIKKVRILLWIKLSIAFVLSIVFQIFVAKDNVLLSFVGYFALMLMVFGAFLSAARANSKIFTPIIAALSDDCDPDTFVAEIEKLRNGQKNSKTDNSLMLDYALGLHYQGDPRSVSLLEGMIGSAQNMSKPLQLIMYNNMSEFSFCAGDYDKAREYHVKTVELCDNMLKTYKNSSKRKAIERIYQGRIIKFKFMSGNYDGLERDLRESFNDPTSRNLNRVTDMYELALYYRHFDDKYNELECMKYVVANGNKLFIAKKAADRVRDLQSETTAE